MFDFRNLGFLLKVTVFGGKFHYGAGMLLIMEILPLLTKFYLFTDASRDCLYLTIKIFHCQFLCFSNRQNNSYGIRRGSSFCICAYDALSLPNEEGIMHHWSN